MSFWASREGTALILDNKRNTDWPCSEPVSGTEQKIILGCKIAKKKTHFTAVRTLMNIKKTKQKLDISLTVGL